MNNQSANFGAFDPINGRQSENVDLWLYERGIAATSCGVTITDATQPHNPIIYCNPAFESITGFPPEEVLGRNCKFLQGKDTDLAVVEQIRQALRTKQECQVVLKNYRKNGTPFWNELKISPVCDRNGNLTNFIGVQTDITSRIESEAALKASETRLRLALNAAKMGVWDWDVDSGKVTWSEEVESIFGLEAGGFGGTYEAYLNCIHPEDCYRVTQQMSRLAEIGGDFKIEHRILLPDGSVRWVVNRGAVLRDLIGAGVRMTGTVMDISDRKQAELALRQQLEIERLLNGIAQRIRQSLKLEEVLNTAVAEVRQFLKTDRVVLYRLNSDDSGVVVVESIAANWMPILGQSIQDSCFASKHFHHYQQGRIRAIEDIQTANIQKCHIKLLESFQVKANLVVPVLQGEKLWGLLIAHHCSEPRKWEEVEVDLLKQLSVQLAIALQQSELYQQVQTELTERKQAEAALRQSENNLKEQAMQLRLALNDLQSAQSQLIQSEKMSSLGQLVAGVAHEINNPVNFISGNINHASQYIQDLLNLVQLYQKNYPNPAEEIQEETEAIDLEFLVEDLPKMLDSMRIGTSRIREIVLSLRNFSRHDEAEKKPVDIHEGIDNTLLILQHRLKPNSNNPGVQVIKNYSDLPQVDCYAGQLNQVFMNIISNAIDALEEQPSPRIITISTELVIKSELGVWSCELSNNLSNNLLAHNYINEKSKGVLIRISDNGSGIPEAVQKKIFDPFFTTKSVGKGTGMGLSISYQVVVDRHGGQLTCLSTPGVGTEFLIAIPLENIEQKNAKAVATDLAITNDVDDQTQVLQRL
ncbi:multi-sensor signal transduction histidine kinase [Crinalium epipsammum PCC 9333]|uniref:histidine kinase n=1 Tax=Crinalium epipsammum PCC 9333 TaxID=1173022 RepID=K9VVG0_9CYAN|nr:PAS domain-containing protein [Crinalium epipsammum]AFZ12078.1 multi-sensor signal transduction histidine kinase [Crinalium epipsammum PCC 9333]